MERGQASQMHSTEELADADVGAGADADAYADVDDDGVPAAGRAEH